MTNHVPTLDTCKKLKEAGWDKETMFYWHLINDNWKLKYYLNFELLGLAHQKILHAPLASEIIAELPKNDATILKEVIVVIIEFLEGKIDNPTEALGKLYCKLAKEGLL